MTAQAAALELIETPNLTTAAEIDAALADTLPDSQLSALEISHEIKSLNIQAMAEMVLHLHETNGVRLQTVDAGLDWNALVEFAKCIRGVAA